MKRFIPLVTLLVACTEAPGFATERWEGIAIPAATDIAAQDSLPPDTTVVRTVFDRDIQTNIVYATFSIWETQPDPCDLTWLDDVAEPCFYITKGTGFGVPFNYPLDRVVDLTLPTLGECELGGQIDRLAAPPVWHAHLRCGPTKRLYYDVSLSEY